MRRMSAPRKGINRTASLVQTARRDKRKAIYWRFPERSPKKRASQWRVDVHLRSVPVKP
ncbi:hypothetical protein MPLA_230026 [Mesorhizobium sp. ORS 3359]|nr:hypothetical protein MPLA_230026 [Mesorhizobium sp. ORS 3359]